MKKKETTLDEAFKSLKDGLDAVSAKFTEAMINKTAAGSGPTPRHLKRRVMLLSWNIVGNNNSGPLRFRLEGYVKGHPTLPDGRYIQTSPLLRLDIPERSAETMHTVYVLQD